MNTTQMEVDLSADYIDVRDIIARVEELREERDSFIDAEQTNDADAGGDEDSRSEYAEGAWIRRCEAEAQELGQLESILEDLAGNGGDEQWEGAWYPVTLIRDSYFETAMDELLEDLGDLPKNLPCYLTITVDYDALRMDYTSIEIDGTDYWYR